ncbi:MAG: Pvc16 family protein [Tepidiformaceae bacterium]
MIPDVDEALRELLTTDVPLPPGEIDIAFDRPTREWSSRLSRPTLNLFLFDVRERMEFRDPNDFRTITPDGRIKLEHPPRRIDLSYVITAWAKEPGDEHRILARVLAAMFRTQELGTEQLAGELEGSLYPVLMRIMPPDHIAKPADLWGVLDNDMRASLTWVATAPLQPVAPTTGPIVRTRELRFREVEGEGPEAFLEIAGVVHHTGDTLNTIPGTRVSVDGRTVESITDADGIFRLQPLTAGEYVLRAETPDGTVGTRSVTIPSPSYDVAV